MISEFFPPWVAYFYAGATSPIVALASKWLPRRLRPVAIFALAMATTAFVCATTPLAWEHLIGQAILLFGLTTTGYTAAAALELGSKQPSLPATRLSCLVLGACLLLVAVVVSAQTAADSLLVGPPVQVQPVQLLVLSGVSLAFSWVARLIREHVAF